MAKTQTYVVTKKFLSNPNNHSSDPVLLTHQSVVEARSRKEALESVIEKEGITVEVYEPSSTTTPESATRTVTQ
jgi:hypothetical protein